MSSSRDEGRQQHPVTDCARRIGEDLDGVGEVPLLSMSPEETRQALVDLARHEAQLSALRLRLLAHAEHSEATVQTGAPTAADWVAVETRQVRRDARSDLRHAQRLEHHDVLSTAMAHGQVNLAQSRAIVAALDRLPCTGTYAVTAEQRLAAEQHLVELAAHHDAKELRILGRRVFEVIAPEVADQFEGKALEREEAQALRRTTLSLWEDDEGTCHGRFRIPALHGQMLTKMILALASPSRPRWSNPTQSPEGTAQDTVAMDRDSGIDPDLPTPVRHGIALTQLLESINASDLPKTGGCGATVVVTMTLEQLLADLETAGVCTLDTGGRISAAEARRLACRAGIVPMVLGGRSQVLDVGRKRRLHTEAMRLAMGVRDGGCTTRGCQTAPGMCHAHHDHPWARGGKTNVQTGRLLCPHPWVEPVETIIAGSTTPPTTPAATPTAPSPSTDGSEPASLWWCPTARGTLPDMEPARPRIGQVVTVFRNRLRPEALEAYAAELTVVTDLARAMPGFVETKLFVAEDGERATVVTFADAASHRAWRDHPRHRTAQRHGIEDYYSEYSIAVGETSYASAFSRPPHDRDERTAPHGTA